jgi:hypothetical protein
MKNILFKIFSSCRPSGGLSSCSDFWIKVLLHPWMARTFSVTMNMLKEP